MIESLEELSALLAERFLALDLPDLTMPTHDDPLVANELEARIKRRVPAAFARVHSSFALAGRNLGVGFGGSTNGADYVEWIVRSTIGCGLDVVDIDDIIKTPLLVVAGGDPFFVLMEVESGDLFAVMNGEAVDTMINLACDFEQLIVGAANIALARGTDQVSRVRRSVAHQLDSPSVFWDCL